MARIYSTQEGKGFMPAQLAKDYSVGPHAQRCNEQILDTDLCLCQLTARCNQSHRIGMGIVQLLSILDSEEALLLRNFREQCV